jgi:UDP-glucose 4-epimerase
MTQNLWGGVVATGRNPRFSQHYKNLGVPYYKVDVCNPDSFKVLDKYSFDAVIHFATMMPSNVPKTSEDDDTVEYYKVNVLGTLNILEYCRKHRINRVISFGTRFDCRLYDSKMIVTEETPLNYSFTDDHAAFVMSNNAKWDVMRYYNEKYGMKNVYFRIPTIFGVGPHGGFYKNGIYIKSGMQMFIEKATVGENIEVYGPVDTMKDLLYVKDLNLGIKQALLQTEASGFYNIGYDNNFRLVDIVQAIVDVFSKDGRKSVVIQREDIPNNGGFPIMDMSKLKREIGFNPNYSNIKDIMVDYKKELERGLYTKLFGVVID